MMYTPMHMVMDNHHLALKRAHILFTAIGLGATVASYYLLWLLRRSQAWSGS